MLTQMIIHLDSEILAFTWVITQDPLHRHVMSSISEAYITPPLDTETTPPPSTDCESCVTGCELCFWTQTLECMRCSPGYNWNGYECIACHSICMECTGPGPSEFSSCVNKLSL